MARATYQVGAKWRPFPAVTAITNRSVNPVILMLPSGKQENLKPGATRRMTQELPDGRQQLAPQDIQVWYHFGVADVLVEDQSLGY